MCINISEVSNHSQTLRDPVEAVEIRFGIFDGKKSGSSQNTRKLKGKH